MPHEPVPFRSRLFAIADCAGARPPDPAYDGIFSLWRDRIRGAGPQGLPVRQEFGFRDFIGWHSMMVISAFDGGVPVFRLVGEGVVDLFGGAVDTDHRFDSMPTAHFSDWPAYFSGLASGKDYGSCTGVVPVERRDHRPLCTLDLPVWDAAAGQVALFTFFLDRLPAASGPPD